MGKIFVASRNAFSPQPYEPPPKNESISGVSLNKLLTSSFLRQWLLLKLLEEGSGRNLILG